MENEERSNILHDLFVFLKESDARPTVLSQIDANSNIILFVSCNWYDSFKAPIVASFAKELPKATIVLAGGRRERFTSLRSEKLGGEPLELRERLLELGVEPHKIVLYNGGRVTTHNVRLLLHYLSQVLEFEGAHLKNSVILFEESFLCRRVRSTLEGCHMEGKPMLYQQLFCVSTGADSLEQLASVHHSNHELAAWLITEEMKRLYQYSKASSFGNPLFSLEIAFRQHISHSDRYLALTNQIASALEITFSTFVSYTKDRVLVLKHLAPSAAELPSP
eukprot:TRINITY_DN10134_c0_g1_i2.p1 TRINITY_DN10134_c0_g1~~TRINITY_DN10134_c0_g1_i2.p1  ORF type:complete len:292 (+),score=34.44 TRINITY_DN10134_c0_g1_i2:45-878(+)